MLRREGYANRAVDKEIRMGEVQTGNERREAVQPDRNPGSVEFGEIKKGPVSRSLIPYAQTLSTRRFY